jgi:diadenylate cyclase
MPGGTVYHILEHAALMLRAALEIGLLALLIYSVLYFLRGTRAVTVLAGITTVVFLLWLISRSLHLDVIEWLLVKLWAVLAFAVLIIFQQEVRRALAETGSQIANFRNNRSRQLYDTAEILLDSVFYLSEHKYGALLVLQQKIGMRALAETGTIINAPLTRELVTTLFFPNTPLHDGGVIIKDNTVVAAGCILPLTQDPDMSKSLGTRHRAGVGVTEETDAVVIIVSEETGMVSLAYRGRLLRGVNRQRLERHLNNFLLRGRRGADGLFGWGGSRRPAPHADDEDSLS